jgi:hypothetical protein
VAVPLNGETSKAVSLAGDTRKGPGHVRGVVISARSAGALFSQCRDCASCRVPPPLHAGVAITAPKGSVIFPIASGPEM